MSEKVNKNQAEENAELSNERLEQASGGLGLGSGGNDVLLGEDGREIVRQSSGDADDRPTEEVAFYYNKIAFQYAKTKDEK